MVSEAGGTSYENAMPVDGTAASASGDGHSPVLFLSSLPAAADCDYAAHEVFVVDDGANDETVRKLLDFAATHAFGDRHILFIGSMPDRDSLQPAVRRRCHVLRSAHRRNEISAIAAMLAGEACAGLPALSEFDAEFSVRTLQDVDRCAALVDKATSLGILATTGFRELVLNGIEHGNLEITFEQKSSLLLGGNWFPEIEKRLRDPRYRDRYVTVCVRCRDGKIEFRIADQGDGFDWRTYIDSPVEATNGLHGRGIAMAIQAGFRAVEYVGAGNEVIVRAESQDGD